MGDEVFMGEEKENKEESEDKERSVEDEELNLFEETLNSLTFNEKKALCIRFQTIDILQPLPQIQQTLTTVFGYSNKTLYRWRREFLKTGKLITSKRGQHWKVWSPLLDENFKTILLTWAREHQMQKGKKSMR